MSKKENRTRRKIETTLYSTDIRRVKDSDWKNYQKEYRKAIDQIEVPPDFKPNDILRINSLIDQIYAQARFDYAYAKRMVTRYNRRLGNAKKQLKLAFPKQKGQTVDEREALIAQFLETSPLEGDKEPLYTLIDRWEDRLIYMEAVLDVLTKLSDKMITGNGALKLDAQGRGDQR